MLHFIPIDIFEEIMRFHLFEADPAVGVLLQQFEEQVSEAETHVSYPSVDLRLDELLLSEGFLVDMPPFFVLEQIFLEHQFVHQHAEGPNVGLLAVFSVQGLRGHVLEGADEGRYGLSVLDDDFREAVVRQFYVSLLSDQQIFRFQLAVDYAAFMKKGDSHQYLRQDISDVDFCEDDFLLAEVEVEIAHGEVLHDDVDVFVVLEGLDDPHQELRVAYLADEFALQHVELLDLGLLDYLHGVTSVVIFLFCQDYAPEEPSAQVFDAFIVFWAAAALPCFGQRRRCCDYLRLLWVLGWLAVSTESHGLWLPSSCVIFVFVGTAVDCNAAHDVIISGWDSQWQDLQADSLQQTLCLIYKMDIRLEDDELILEKLAKIKCERGCQNAANYIVFQMGVYCTLCLSKLEHVPPSHLATFEDLSKIIAELAQQYSKDTKTGSNLYVLKAQAEQQNALLKPLRDRVTLDAKAIQSQANHIINSAETNCLKESRNEALENFFEPDVSASMLINDTQLFMKNLKNLQVVQENGKVRYEFRDASKNPATVKAQSLKQLEKISSAIGVAHLKAKAIMSRFRESISQ